MAPRQLNLPKAQKLKPPRLMGDTTSATRPRLPRPNRRKRRKADRSPPTRGSRQPFQREINL